MTWNGIDMTQVLSLLGSIVVMLLGWLATSIKKKQDAGTAQSKAETATLKLAAIGAALLQKAWNDLGPKIQAALADGTMSTEERLAIEASVQSLLSEVTDDATLKSIAEALGLPLPGVIAKIAATLIDIWTKSHDPAVTTQSKLAFPVAKVDYGPDAAG